MPSDEQRGAKRRTLRRRLGLALVLAVALVWLQRVLSRWVDRTSVFITGAVVLIALAWLVGWALSTYGPALWRILRSLAGTLARAFPEDPEIRRLVRERPRLTGLVRRRTTLKHWTGLYLTITVVLTVSFLYWFAIIARSIGLAAGLTKADPQISALFRAFRAVQLTDVMWVATVLGEPRVMIALTVVVGLLMLAWGKRREALVFLAASASAALMADALKLLVHRARPLASLALIKTPSSFSFPSGHALGSIVFFGMLWLLLGRHVRPLWWRFLLLGAAVLAVVTIGVSRVYLGVHWTSDVVASWLLGAAWMSAWFGGYLMYERYGPPRTPVEPLGGVALRRGLTAAAVVVTAAAIVTAALRDPLLRQVTAPEPAIALPAGSAATGGTTLPQSSVDRLPRFSETLTGARQEPVGLIFIATPAELYAAFEKAGWAVADMPTPASLVHAAVAAIADQPYPTAPVTPDFLDSSVQTVAFEKPVGRATIRRRHHVRIWRTRFSANGEPIWVATASLDSRLEIGSTLPLPTHHIEPNIDFERDFTVHDLQGSGVIGLAGYVRVSPPLAGTDAQGDRFFTLGRAAVMSDAAGR